MIKHPIVAIVAILLVSANLPAKSDSAGIPAERIFASSVCGKEQKSRNHQSGIGYGPVRHYSQQIECNCDCLSLVRRT